MPNMWWTLTLSVFALVLDPCLSTLSLSPSSLEVVKYENESYFVFCQTDDKIQIPKIYWTKGKSQQIDNKGLTYVAPYGNGTALFFGRITSKDSGEYACHARDEVVAFKLIVTSPIAFVDTASLQTVQELRPGIIKCKIQGDSNPTVIWKFDGKDLPPKKYKFIPDGLKILNVSLEDEGIYTCRAYQVSQVASMFIEKAIQLNIQHKPLHKKPVHAKVNQAYGYVGGIVNLTCEAVAEPAANFTWYRQHKKTMPGRIIEQPHFSILQLYIQNATVFGDYLCKAQNSLGTLDQIITLQEGVKPPSPRMFSLRAAGSDILELDIIGPDQNSTKKEFTNLMLPTGYRIEYKVKGHDKKIVPPKDKKQHNEGITEGWEDATIADFEDGIEENDPYPYIITNLMHNTVYEIRVATRNIAGLSDYIGPHEYETLRLHADSVKSTGVADRPLGLHLILVCVSSMNFYMLGIW